MPEFLSPRHIEAADKTERFDCGEASLNNWLRNFAWRNEKGNASRTFVSVVAGTNEAAGFYCLAASSLRPDDGPVLLTTGMPNPVPVIVIGRLAVDLRYAGLGLGFSLLRHALLRAIQAADSVGSRAILVYALNSDVVWFYEKFGFTRFPGQSNTLYLLTADATKTLGA